VYHHSQLKGNILNVCKENNPPFQENISIIPLSSEKCLHFVVKLLPCFELSENCRDGS
jgi:hypothetical protein